MDAFLEFLANGLFLGGIIALLSLPLSVVWVTTDVIDVATGGYAVAAAVVATAIGLPLGAIAGVGTAVVLGAIMGTIFLGFHSLRTTKDAMLIVLSSFAVMIAVEAAVLTVFGTDSKFLPRIAGTWQVGHAVLPYQGAFNLAIAILVMAGLAAMLRWSTLGLSMRASAISPTAASLVGVAVRRTQFFAFVLGAGISGLAGLLAVMTIGVTYFSAFPFTLLAFSGAVLLGRRGPIYAFVGGLLLGVVDAVSQAYLPSGWAAGVPSLLIIVVLASGRLPATAFGGARP